MGPEAYLQALDATGMQRAIASPQVSATSWANVGPVGGFGPRLTFNGRVAGIRVRAASGGGYHVYVGGSGGGLWRSHSSASGVWTELSPALPNPAVRAFAIDPADGNRIVVGTGDAGRYKGAGAYYTSDGGATWTPAALPSLPESFYRLDFLLGSSNVLVAASSVGILRSTDGGAGWQLVWAGHATDLRLHPTDPDTMYAVARGVGFLRSTDGGIGWGAIPGSTGLPPADQWGRASMAICRGTPTTIVVMIGTVGAERDDLLGLWRTTNAGASWTEITGDLPDIGDTQMFHAQAVAIKPDDPDHIYAGSVNLARTTNGGTNWVQHFETTDFDIGHADVTQLLFAPASGDGKLWICNDGGIYLHDIAAKTTVGLNGNGTSGLVLSQIDHAESRRAFQVIGLQDNGELRSEDTGATWTFVPNNTTGGDGGAIQITDAEAHDFWYWLGVPWAVYRVLSAGGSVPMQAPAGASASFFYDRFADRIYVPVDTEIHSMPAGGAAGSWTAEPVPALHPDPYSIWTLHGSRADGKTFYVRLRDALDRDLSVARWTGSTWTVQVTTGLAPAGGHVQSVAPSSEWPGEAWVGCSGPIDSPKVFHTTDFGATWEDVTAELSAVANVWALAATPFDPLTVYAATEIGVFRTTDGGRSWQPFQDGMPVVQCKDLKYVVDPSSAGAHRLVAATYGRGLWTRTVPSRPVVYVDRTHVGSEDGSIERPYDTVAEAVTAAAPGAIVALRANAYQAPQLISKNLLLVSWAGASVLD